MARRHRYGKPDRNQKGIVKVIRDQLKCYVKNTTAVGGGFPDLVVGFKGLTILIEVKMPGGSLRDSQVEFIEKWPGGPLLQVRDGQDAVDQILALRLPQPE